MKCLCLLLLCLAFTGCGSSIIVDHDPLPPIIPTDTPVAVSLQFGTGLSGSGQNVSIVNPKTSFTQSDMFAFIIRLRASGNSPKANVVIIDSLGNPVYTQDIPLQLSDRVIAASFGPLGRVLKEPPLDTAPMTPPAGSYILNVLIYPSPLVTVYASYAPFTYTP